MAGKVKTTRARLLRAGILAVLTVAFVPATSLAAPPTLTQVGQQGRHITASWTLAGPNYATRAIEVADSDETRNGSFWPSSHVFAYEEPGTTAKSWTSESTIAPGTYYVHVLGEDLGCPSPYTTCTPLEWSNVLTVVIPNPKPPPPTGLSVRHRNGRIVVSWKLPGSQYFTDLVEAAKRPALKSDGQFVDRSVVDYDFFSNRTTTWTSKYVGPGTYYVHVATEFNFCGKDQDEECDVDGWSRAVKVVIPRSEGPRHFRGRTSQGRSVSFTVLGDRVTGMRIGYRFSCNRGTRSGSGSLGSTSLGRGGVFSDHDDWRFTDGSTASSLIRGDLKSTHRATGTFSMTTHGGFNRGCSTGRVTWTARWPGG